MRQDIKVDIVYYMTATDFEFEFNLGGCCHMRLLNDKASDKKSFVNSLARAVSRSRIIISCGPLFGEDGLISIIAAAIGKPLEKISNESYGIDSQAEISIISGSVPLVTPEGIFGGCIIESGTQSIIVLSESRSVRKSIMKTLVHPYIEEISVMNSAGKTVIDTSAEEPTGQVLKEEITTEEPPLHQMPDTVHQEVDKTYITESTEEDEDLGDEETEEQETSYEEDESGEHNLKFDYSFGDDEPTTDDGDQTDTADVGTSIDDSDLLIRDVTEPDSRKSKNRGLNISIIIVTAVLLLAILALTWFLVAMPYINGVSISEYFNSIFGDFSAEKLI